MNVDESRIAPPRHTVAIVVGGESGEHEISLASGKEVLAQLDNTLWDPFLVRIERNGTWCLPGNPDINAPAACLNLGDGINAMMAKSPDVVFPVMHGPYGEDGKFQALLELLHLPFVGSNAETSAIAMNKARAREVLAAAGIQVPPAQELFKGDTLRIKAPCVVKPMHLGSSVGLTVVQEKASLELALSEAFEHGNVVLVEEFVAGKELTVGVLEDENGVPQVLPVIAIEPLTNTYFDFHAKYTPGATKETCPAPISDTLRDQVQAIALTAHRALGCKGMSRTDMIADANGIPWVLETNTIPGMTKTSLLPQAAEAAGIEFSAMLTRMLRCALR